MTKLVKYEDLTNSQRALVDNISANVGTAVDVQHIIAVSEWDVRQGAFGDLDESLKSANESVQNMADFANAIGVRVTDMLDLDDLNKVGDSEIAAEQAGN